MLSESVQNYLKAIYALREDGQRATTNALAERLGVAAASVTGMLKKLDEMSLIAYEPYQGATLTPAGARIALEVVRHHRLIELYLTSAMGYSWDKVHAEAERLEHAISEDFEDAMARVLGDPSRDPHGDPIPTKDGQVAPHSRLTLCELSLGRVGRIERVRDADPAVLRRAAQLGLRPGARVTVLARSAEDGTLTVCVNATTSSLEQVIDAAFAREVFVVTADANTPVAVKRKGG